MIQQLFKQMFAEKRIFLAAAILLFEASFAATAIQLRGVSDSTCFMDAFPAVSANMRYAIYPIGIFIIIALLKDEFSISNVLRRKKPVKSMGLSGFENRIDQYLSFHCHIYIRFHRWSDYRKQFLQLERSSQLLCLFYKSVL